MTYDEYDNLLPKTKDQLVADLAETEKEIAWNERRLGTLVLDEVDRQLTKDLVADLRQERQKLLAVING